jgi:hypothetical protein
VILQVDVLHVPVGAKDDADDDFDGDGWVDGDDLAYIASNLGRCWSASAKNWSLSACPTGLQ